MIKVPARYHCNTGPNSDAYDQIDRFFDYIKTEINEPRDRPSRFERRDHSHERSDDVTYLLLYQDEVVATVTETRTMGNYVNFTFFANLENLAEE